MKNKKSNNDFIEGMLIQFPPLSNILKEETGIIFNIEHAGYSKIYSVYWFNDGSVEYYDEHHHHFLNVCRTRYLLLNKTTSQA